MLQKIMVTATLLCLIACGNQVTPQYNYIGQFQKISRPEIGMKTKAYVGDILLSQGMQSIKDTLYLANETHIAFGMDLPAGYYDKIGSDAHSEFYSILRYKSLGGEVSGDDLTIQVKEKKGDNAIICIISTMGVATCSDEIPVKFETRTVEANNAFQQTLIYSGKTGNNINLSYREFANNIARPAFSNDVQYDLNSSKIIAYKGASLEVLNANNEFIEYKVLKNFNTKNN